MAETPRVVLITGASAGIGRATADRLQGSGWTVVGASRRGASSGGWQGLTMDVDDDDDVARGVSGVLSEHGRLDALVAAAGWGLAGPVEATPIAEAKAQLETNFWGAVRVVQASLPAMRERRAGRIVLVSSIGGLIALPFQAFYSASKFALEGYGEALAYEVRPFGIEVLDPARVRFRLKQPWPDFITFYSTTGAAWIVPKKYVEKVGDDGFKKAQIGAGPYRFVSYTPGVELVVDAFGGYWRKMPAVKRLVFKAIPDESTRLAALKRGEIDVAYGMSGALAEELRRTPGLTLKPVAGQVVDWVNFTEQWDARSPWHDRRVRLAATYAIDRQAMNLAERLGFARITWSLVPPSFEFYWQPPGYGYDPGKARQLLAEAGYPGGFDAGDYFCDASLSYMGEPVVNYLNAIGIRVKLRPIERAAFQKGWIEKKHRGLVQGGNGSFGNAATRIESLVVGGGTYVYGSYADIDGLFREQAGELDRKKREAILHHIQQLIYDKAVVAPIWQNVPLNGVGPRVEESGIGLVAGYIYSAPYEDVRLKGK